MFSEGNWLHLAIQFFYFSVNFIYRFDELCSLARPKQIWHSGLLWLPYVAAAAAAAVLLPWILSCCSCVFNGVTG